VHLAASVALVVVGAFGASASTVVAAPEPGSLEEQCIAAATVLPQEAQGFMFNHHPEKKREPRAGDHYLTVLETVAEFNSLVPRIPDACGGHFSQVVLAKAQFQTTKSPHRWRSLRQRWERLPLAIDTLEFIGDPPPLSSFGLLRGQQTLNTFGLGCTLGGRVDYKLEVVNEANQAIVAVREATVPLQVDSWFEARCLGTFSIQESSGARRCGQVVGARAGAGPSLWGVKVAGVGCSRGRAVAQQALEQPGFLKGSLLEQRLDGWRCFYGHRGAAACQRGGSHIFLVGHRGGTGEACPQAPRGALKLEQAGTSCDVALGLAEALAAAPRTESVLTPAAGGRTFACASLPRLGLGDRMEYSYACAAGGAVVTFELREPKSARLVPAPPSSIAPEVRLPPAGLLGFPRTPTLKFDYGVLRGGKIVVPLEVDGALVGRRAEITFTVRTAKCEWTADPGQTEPICGATRLLGSPKTRAITLREKQTITLGPNRKRGNWIYEARVKTKPFVSAGLPYTHALGSAYWSVINEATNCSANPWCHPHHKRAGRA
jgi:hypothetical protein